MRKLNWAVVAFAFAFHVNGAKAQTYGTDYVAFEGRGVVLDNPPSAACQSIGVAFGSVFTIVYRFSADPSVIADALAFVGNGRSEGRIISTQSPNFSLNGTNTVTWTYIGRHADFQGGILPSTTSMTIV